MIMNRTISEVRNLINIASRHLLKEPTRKKIVEAYYANKANKLNRTAPTAPHSVDDIIDWKSTLGFRFSCSRGVYRGNCFYGAAYWMQRYANSSASIKACVEHGLYFGNYVNQAELDNSGMPCLITFGPSRIKHITEVSNVPAISVGPYIAYAEDYLSGEDTKQLKEKLGKVLLVFPSHSIDRVKVSFETNDLIDEINRVSCKNKIQRVLVCLYYRDILNGNYAQYEKAGFTVVTAGYREDCLFLSRLRSLISISDLTMSNSVGTHVGYCVYMGKPHYVYGQAKLFSADSASDEAEFINPYADTASSEKQIVASAFMGEETSDNAITEICDYFWGFKNVLSRSEMSELLQICEKAYQFKAEDRQAAFRALLNSTHLVG